MSAHATINVGDGDVLRAARDVAATREVLVARTGQMHQRLQQLGGQWAGRGELAFQGAIQAWQRTADRVVAALDGFHEQLTSADATYEQTETGVEQRLNRYAAGLG